MAVLKFPFLKNGDPDLLAWARQLVDTLNRAQMVPGSEVPPTGMMAMWPSDKPLPFGWIAVNGATLDRDKHRALFLAYGGSGMSFTLPDYSGALPGITFIVRA
jgi:hypothetical protein